MLIAYILIFLFFAVWLLLCENVMKIGEWIYKKLKFFISEENENE